MTHAALYRFYRRVDFAAEATVVLWLMLYRFCSRRYEWSVVAVFGGVGAYLITANHLPGGEAVLGFCMLVLKFQAAVFLLVCLGWKGE